MAFLLHGAFLISLCPALTQSRERLEESAARSGALAPTVFVGRVVGARASPASGAVVVTSAGGESVTRADGSFELALDVPLAAECVEVSATAGGAAASGSLCASVRVVPSSLSATTDVGRLVLAPSASCTPRWLPTFGQVPGTDDEVHALAVFDDGHGPALYVGGEFVTAGGLVVNHVARWDGRNWSALGSGTSGDVRALTVFDDGSGPALYVGGFFASAGGASANGIARWDGSSWSPLASGFSGGSGELVYALAVFDDGTGAALYAGGGFTAAGGAEVRKVSRWDGSSWLSLGTGMHANDQVHALAVFDDGSGPALYAGGIFQDAGGVATGALARWDGSSWSALGSGVAAPVEALALYDDGSGEALYVGGNFTSAGGVSASRIAKWDGASWSALGSGTNSSVEALTVLDDGTGPVLCVGGLFGLAGGAPASHLATWDGSSWSAVADALDQSVLALATFDAGHGRELCAGGQFTDAGGVKANHVARWNGSAWRTLGDAPNLDVLALATLDSGGGPALYAGGLFTVVGGLATNRIARWDGHAWTSLGSGMNFGVRALCVFDDGGGPALYAAGDFTTAGGASANRIARWDGSTWSALGSGLDGIVRSLAVFDDGTGPALYAGGDFTSAGGAPASGIARWDGANWSPLASGVSFGRVYAMAVFDDGTGAKLFVGGSFTQAGGAPARKAATWDGTSWSGVPGILFGGAVEALTVFDDGSGPALYAGGGFTTAGGTPASRVAKWNGSSWSALGSGVNNQVSALAVYDDGAGARLYAGGLFTSAGGATASRIASWNGAAWSAVGGGLINGADGCRSLVVFDPGSGPRLYAGGDFNTAGSTSANRVASWNGSSWAALGTGVSGGLVAEVMALVVHDDGTGPALYVGGTYASAGGVAASSVAKWDGSSWSALGSGLSDPVQPEVTTLASFDDGSGPALHVAGGFSKAGALDENNVARWRGSTWSALRSGPLGLNSSVRALEVYDDGSGAALYVGGDFTSTGSITAKGIAKWDGASWSPLAPLYSETRVGALAVFDDGAGPALYAEVFPGAAPMVVARWNGSSWSVDPGAPASGATAFLVHDDGSGAALYACGGGGVSRRNGSGTSWPFLGSLRGDVRALVVFDDGTGPALYAGGDFTLSSVFGSPRRSVARWDGSSWDGGVGQGLPDKAFALAVFDDGSGAALYAGTSSAGLWKRSGSSWSLVGGGLHVEVRSLAVFDDGSGRALYAGNGDGVFRHEGSSLSLLGSGTAGSFFDHGGVYALKTFDDGSGPALYVGGGFGSVPDSGDSFLARWSGCPDSLAPEISCPPSVHAIAPFGATGKVVSFTVTALDNLDASPTVVCVPASGSFFPLGTTMVSCTATDDLGNQSTCQFPLIVKERTRREAR